MYELSEDGSHVPELVAGVRLSYVRLMLYFNTVLNTTIYNYLKGVYITLHYIKSYQHVSVVHSTIIRP